MCCIPDSSTWDFSFCSLKILFETAPFLDLLKFFSIQAMQSTFVFFLSFSFFDKVIYMYLIHSAYYLLSPFPVTLLSPSSSLPCLSLSTFYVLLLEHDAICLISDTSMNIVLGLSFELFWPNLWVHN